jgi:hypothetical protein
VILVYFTNGESAAMPAGTHVRTGPSTKGGTDGTVHPGITCLEAEGREVGRFRVARSPARTRPRPRHGTGSLPIRSIVKTCLRTPAGPLIGRRPERS